LSRGALVRDKEAVFIFPGERASMTIFKIFRLMIVILSLSLMSVAPPAHADSWKEATKAYAAYADDSARLPIQKVAI
jgi:hypothetical protein